MSKKKSKNSRQLTIKMNDSIGEAGAEDDDNLLFECFLKSAAFDVMRDVSNPKRILIGGTGAGKTAFIEYFYKYNKANCIKLSLDDAYLTYLSSSNILDNLEEHGINLNILYQRFWKHILAVQLLQKKLDYSTELNDGTLFNKIKRYFKEKSPKTKAQEFLDELERDFWLEPNDYIEKTTTEIISRLGGEIDINSLVNLGASITNQNKIDTTVRNKIQKSIEGNQLQLLSKVINFLNDEVFTNDQKPFFVLIDELDTDWVTRRRKYHLIRALIETVKNFRKVRNVKIIVALRTDLYDRIIAATRDEGFQQDKYKTFLLTLDWQKDELFELVSRRINKVFSSRYTSQSVTFHDIAPDNVNDKRCFDYLFDRTFQRPRHIIMFINECISESVGKSKFTQKTVKEAEKKYSQQRLEAIKEEWGESYGLIDQALQLLEKIKKTNFEVSSISDELINDVAESIDKAEGSSKFDCDLKEYAVNAFIDQDLGEKFLANLFKMLYHIGIVGIKPGPNDSYDWYFEHHQNLSASRILKNTSVKIHPMFWRTLGITNIEDD